MYLGLVLFTDIQRHKTNTGLTTCAPFRLILSSLPHTQVSVHQNPGIYCIGAWLDPTDSLGVLGRDKYILRLPEKKPGTLQPAADALY